MYKALVVDNAYGEKVYGTEEIEAISRHVELVRPVQNNKSLAADPKVLEGIELLFTGWSGIVLDKSFLDSASCLKVIFNASGSIRRMVTAEFWGRHITITTAAAANAVPVAQYTVSQILALLKGVWREALRVKRDRSFRKSGLPIAGCYRSTVGIVSLGLIGRLVCEYLRTFGDIHVLAHDPLVTAEQAEAVGAVLCPLEELFEKSDVVSLHTPLLAETKGMIQGEHFRSMKPHACFINTARGAVIREQEMIEVLRERPDLFAILDVTSQEPPPGDSELFELDNVILTPHIAGSQQGECRRLARAMVEELKRYLAGEPLCYAVDKAQAARMA